MWGLITMTMDTQPDTSDGVADDLAEIVNGSADIVEDSAEIDDDSAELGPPEGDSASPSSTTSSDDGDGVEPAAFPVGPQAYEVQVRLKRDEITGNETIYCENKPDSAFLIEEDLSVLKVRDLYVATNPNRADVVCWYHPDHGIAHYDSTDHYPLVRPWELTPETAAIGETLRLAWYPTRERDCVRLQAQIRGKWDTIGLADTEIVSDFVAAIHNDDIPFEPTE